MLSEPERAPHTAGSPWLIRAVDLDGDGAKDLVIVDTESDHPIHVRFATDEKKLGPEQRFALEVPRAVAFGQIDGQGGSEILVLEGGVGPGQGADPRPVGRRRGQQARPPGVLRPAARHRARPLAGGRRPRRRHKKDVIVTDPANAQVWVYLQTAHSGLSSGQTFPSLGNARTVRLAPLGPAARTRFTSSRNRRSRSAGAFSTRAGCRFRRRSPWPASRSRWTWPTSTATRSSEILYVARTKAGGDAFELRGVTGDKPGRFAPPSGARSNRSRFPASPRFPPAIKTLDINHDGQTDLLDLQGLRIARS